MLLSKGREKLLRITASKEPKCLYLVLTGGEGVGKGHYVVSLGRRTPCAWGTGRWERTPTRRSQGQKEGATGAGH